jgi:hypothetical protein
MLNGLCIIFLYFIVTEQTMVKHAIYSQEIIDTSVQPFRSPDIIVFDTYGVYARQNNVCSSHVRVSARMLWRDCEHHYIVGSRLAEGSVTEIEDVMRMSFLLKDCEQILKVSLNKLYSPQ